MALNLGMSRLINVLLHGLDAEYRQVRIERHHLRTPRVDHGTWFDGGLH
jgi:hypothetical protein